MALVDYTSSDDSDRAVKPGTHGTKLSNNMKRNRDEMSSDLPPLPTKFHDLYASTARVSTRDDPNLHGGRKRVTPHIDGNWPTHLYIEWYPTTAEHDLLTKLISSFQDGPTPVGSRSKVQTFLTSDLGAPLPLHISLSRPIGFSTQQKDFFVASLRQSVDTCSVRPFDLSLMSLEWVPNFEKTRWFIVLRLQRSDRNALNKLLKICNDVVEEYGQPPLYTPPTISRGPPERKPTPEQRIPETDSREAQDLSEFFHISIGWMLEAPSPYAVSQVQTILKGKLFEAVKTISFKVDEIKAKVGNVVATFQLPLQVIEKGSLFDT